MVQQIYRLFAAAGKGDCSDPTTNYTFDYLGEALPYIFQTSLANVVLESILCAVMGIFVVLCGH